MPAKRILFTVALSASALLLAGCTTTGPIDPPASAKASASAKAAANTCDKATQAKLASDLFDPASCVVVTVPTEGDNATQPSYASGNTVVYTSIHATDADTKTVLTGVSGGKQAWSLSLPKDVSVKALMHDGTPALQVEDIVVTHGDAVAKASAKYTLDYYGFDGKKLESVDGLPGTVDASSVEGDEEEGDDTGVSVLANSADANGQVGYTSTNDGIFYVDPDKNKTTFLASDGWTHTVPAGYQSTPYGANALLANRTIFGFNEDGFLTDDYDGFEHSTKQAPSYLRFITFDGKPLWSVKVSHDDTDGGASAQVYGNVAQVEYVTYNEDLDGKHVEQWIDIESGKEISANEAAEKIKAYRNFVPTGIREPDLLIGSDNSIVYTYSPSVRTDATADQLAVGSDGKQHRLDESDARNKLTLYGVVGDTYFGDDGLRYNASTDTATVAKVKGSNELLPKVVVDDGAYITDNGGQVYFIKFAA